MLSEQLSKQTASFKQSPATATSDKDLIQGVSIPVSINRNGGKLRIYINLSPDVLGNPQALNAALNQIEESFDLDVWKPSGSSDSTGFKSGNRSGSYQRSKSW